MFVYYLFGIIIMWLSFCNWINICIISVFDIVRNVKEKSIELYFRHTHLFEFGEKCLNAGQLSVSSSRSCLTIFLNLGMWLPNSISEIINFKKFFTHFEETFNEYFLTRNKIMIMYSFCPLKIRLCLVIYIKIKNLYFFLKK